MKPKLELPKQKNIPIEEIETNLERRFQTLLEHKDEAHFMILESEYINYLGRTKEVGDIIIQMAKDGKVNKETMSHLFFVYTTNLLCDLASADCEFLSLFKKKDFIFPSFIDKTIDDKFNIAEEFREVLLTTRREDEEKIKKGLPIFNPATDFMPEREDNLYLLQKLHNNLMEELTEIENSYDDKITEYKDGILFFVGKKIDFNRKHNQKDLLTTMFREPHKNWYYDEIQEDWDPVMGADLHKDNPNYWKKFYSAGDKISNAIALETQVGDFLIKDTKQIQINPKYLNKKVS